MKRFPWISLLPGIATKRFLLWKENNHCSCVRWLESTRGLSGLIVAEKPNLFASHKKLLSLGMSYPPFSVKVSKSRTGQVVNKVASQSSHGLRNELVKKDGWRSRGLTSSLIL